MKNGTFYNSHLKNKSKLFLRVVQKESAAFFVFGWKLKFTLPEKLTASSHLKLDGWNTIVSFWDGLFSGAKSC